jgi:ankyrin repeat protein
MKLRFIRLLLESKAEANSKNQIWKTLLAWAAYSGCTGVVNLLLYEPISSIDSEDRYGRTPLHWSMWNGYSDVVTMFLNRGASEPVDL